MQFNAPLRTFGTLPLLKNTIFPTVAAGVLVLGSSLGLLHAAPSTANSASAAVRNTSPSELDAIVAIVNRGVITKRQLDQRVLLVKSNIQRAGQNVPPLEVLQKEVLERLIIEKVQLQEAADVGIAVQEKMLQQALVDIAQQNKMSLEQWRKTIEQSGQFWGEYTESVRNELILLNMRDIAVRDLVKVSESEIDGHLRGQRIAELNIPQVWKVAQILVHVPEDASDAEKNQLRKRAEDLLTQLRQGANFVELAKKASDGTEADQGGVLGAYPPAGWPKIFANELVNMNSGDISRIVESPNGFHILKMVEKRVDRPASQPSPNVVVDQARARHILIPASEILSIEQAKLKIADIRNQIIKGTLTFEEAAKKYSTDSSAPLGGDLGWISPGQTVPPFEKAMNSLTVGQISEPVLSQFGWHIIQVEEKRQFDATTIIQRQRAESEIRQRKASRAYEDWVNQLRSRAYIEIRLDNARR